MLRIMASLVLCLGLALAQNGIQIAKDSTAKAYLTTTSGQTLYLYIPFDKYSVPWAKQWPDHLVNWVTEWKPLLYTKNFQIGQGLNKVLFGVRVRDDGSLQLTYQGWPLYTHVGDRALGNQAGYIKGLWEVAALNIGTTKIRRDSPLSSKLVFTVQGFGSGP